jgi:dihydrolipoamide dehydrogenase
MDVTKMVARKDTVVKQNNDGILYLFKKNKVSLFSWSRLVSSRLWMADLKSRSAALTMTILMALRSLWLPDPMHVHLPGAAFDEEMVLSNDGALRIGAVPKKLGLIGSGVIGLEMGSVWRRLGCRSHHS